MIIILILFLTFASRFAYTVAAFSECNNYIVGDELQLTGQSTTCELDGAIAEQKNSNYVSGNIYGKMFLRNGAEINFQDTLTIHNNGYIIVGGTSSILVKAMAMTIDGKIVGDWRWCKTNSITTDTAYCGGWAPQSGPGSYTGDAHAPSHGGLGRGSGAEPVYGNFMQPIEAGSGGVKGTDGCSNNAPGGAAIHIVVEDTLTLNGVVNMNGAKPDNCGGCNWCVGRGASGASGGSVWIETATFAGSGEYQLDLIRTFGTSMVVGKTIDTNETDALFFSLPIAITRCRFRRRWCGWQ